jgi:membrane-associated phospholipid phosphatase
LKIGLIVSLFCAVLCGGSQIYAQSDSTHVSLNSTLGADAKTIWHNAGEVFTAPLHFNKGEWLITGGILVGTVTLFAVDESGRSLALRNQSRIGDDIFKVGREYGRAQYGLALSGGLYIIGLLEDNDEIRSTGVMVFESLMFAGAMTTVLKSALGRGRPYLEEGVWSFRGMQFDDDRYSMPSGHSTVAFAVSSSLAARIKNIWATVGLYSLATLTAASRVYHDEHWVSDNFLGAAIGTAVGIAVVHLHEERNDSHTQIRFVPFLNGLRAEMIF